MEEQNEYITGLFNTKSNYIIYNQVYGNKTFYKVLIQKTDFDGQKVKAYIPVRFLKCNPVENGTFIRIKNAKVDWYKNPKDPWNIVPSLLIFNYEVTKESNTVAQQFLNDFNNTSEGDDLPF